jgi:HPt (histidine-containing phosphotransfer) domain-containing protein
VGVIYTKKIDPDIADLVPSYIASRKQEVDEIVVLIEKGNLDAVRILGHNMKGVASSYGFEPLSELGALLEAAAIDHDRESTIQTVQKIKTYLASLELGELGRSYEKREP